jgi:quinol monooxygenase YgiN
MWTSLRRLAAVVFASLLLAATAFAGGAATTWGPVYDITHFDVLPVTSPFDSEQVAYPALFKYRDASEKDAGSESFRVVNWLVASNHSQIIDVWRSLDAFEAHLAQPDSVDFRYAVQVQPQPAPPLFNCCIGSPIDDRQYSLVKTFNLPWTSDLLPAGVGLAKSALFVVTYIDFLVNGDPATGEVELVRYGSETSKASGQLSYTVLQQLDRPNRFATLEVWDSETDYEMWQNDTTTTKFVTTVTPLFGSPPDHRLNILCGETYVDGTGCVAP